MCKGRMISCCIAFLLFVQTGFTQPANSGTAAVNTGTAESTVLGKYDLYSGIPSVYLGHIVIMKDGKYKVAFGTDENAYETGSYKYHADTNTIEWTSGLFYRKAWKGKLIKKSGGYRIELNSTTFAESN